jgi:DNA-binding LacI/PurR family transcriptional regulator
MKRPTISDIAQRARVSKSAVSYALNGRPGVSGETRERILAIAGAIGYQPSNAARALKGGRAGAFGLVIDRPPETLGSEPYFMRLISGIQADLSAHHVTLQFTMAASQDAEIEMYRRWWAEGRVDGIFVVDLQVGDRRIGTLEEMRMPAVAIGTPRGAGALPALWQDDRAAMEMVVGHLAGLGHRRIARVGGYAKYWHSALRSEALFAVSAAAGIQAVSVAADYTSEHGAEMTRTLLESADLPTAVIYDNDVMAVAGLGVAQQMGLGVPADVSILSWEDSTTCEVIHPSLTALCRDIPAAGATAARMLREVVTGGRPGNHAESAPVLHVRMSTGPARVPRNDCRADPRPAAQRDIT